MENMELQPTPHILENDCVFVREATQQRPSHLRSSLARVGLALGLALGINTTVSATEQVMAHSNTAAAADVANYPYDQSGSVDISSAKGEPYTWGYENCLSGMNCNVSLTMNGKRYYYRDGEGYDIKNCTSYVAWRVKKEFGVDAALWGNAAQWDDSARGSFTVDSSPEPGDIAVWDNTTFGHVAFVESTNANGTVNVAQYNKKGQGEFSTQTGVTANHYIDINGTGNIWNGTPTTQAGHIPYAAVADGQEFYSDEGWVYTRTGGTAWPIKHKNNWTSGDTTKWGNKPLGPVPTDEVHDHEAGYGFSGSDYGAHPPADKTTVYEDGSSQQWYFVDGNAYPIGTGELDDLDVRNKALRIPTGRLSEFEDKILDLPNGSLYRYAGNSRVNQLIKRDGYEMNDAFWVNNDTVLSCLGLTQGKSTLLLPQSAVYFLEGFPGVQELSNPAACSFPSGMVLFGPGGLEQWRITGDNSSEPYSRHYYQNALTTYLHTSGNPDYRVLGSVAALNGVPQGADMTPPNGQYFENDGNGDVFNVDGGVFRKVPWPDMLACLGNPSIIHVPGNVVGPIVQGSNMGCEYDNRVVVRPDGRAYYIINGLRHPIGTPAVRDCISVRLGAGAPVSTSDNAVNTYPESSNAYCHYETEPGLNFVEEAGDPTVWLVHPNGTKQHVGRLCVADAYTTVLKKFHVWEVPRGETAEHVQTGDFYGDPTTCAELPG